VSAGEVFTSGAGKDTNADAAKAFIPALALSIFLVSSWAKAKMMNTNTNNTTTKFFSDKIRFIKA
jgi:hypothetical protein